MSEQASKAPMQFTVYYGTRRFLLLAPSFVLDRAQDPYRRLAATVLIARGEPFHLEVDDGTQYRARVALIAPNVPRRRVIALDSDLAIFDIPIHSPEFVALEPAMRGHPVQTLEFERISQLGPSLEKASVGAASCVEVQNLFSAVATAVSGRAPVERSLDSRIEKAMQLIGELPFCEATLESLSGRLHLSPSRLRHLFKDETGSTVSHFTRWAAVWKVVSLWTQGKALTEIAHEVGFYDLAHLDHAFIEVFGLNPSTIIDPRNVTLIRCA